MGTRTEVFDTRMANTKVYKKEKYGVMIIPALADNFQLTVEMPPVIFADPAGGAKDILMPADSADLEGLCFTIINTADAAETITLKTSADAALTPAVAITQNTAVKMIHGGGTGLTGWRRADGL